MNFELNAEQAEIKRTARDLLASRLGPARVRELVDREEYDEKLMAEIAELGWVGIPIAEDLGGVGLGLVELVAIQEELGYALAPVPFLPAVGTAMALAAAAPAEVRDRWLSRVIDGEARGAVGLPGGEDGALLQDGDAADLLLLVGPDGGCFERGEVEVEAVPAMDQSRRFARVRPTGPGSTPGPDADDLLPALGLLVAAESLGIAARSLEMAVAYAKDRKQFGQPIGTYQAVSHRCAQMLLEVESARSAIYYAAWACQGEPEGFVRAAACANAYGLDAGWRVSTSAVQVHGGIGFTWEHDLHFFVKRARLNTRLFGDSRTWRGEIADRTVADLLEEPR